MRIHATTIVGCGKGTNASPPKAAFDTALENVCVETDMHVAGADAHSHPLLQDTNSYTHGGGKHHFRYTECVSPCLTGRRDQAPHLAERVCDVEKDPQA